MSKDSAARRLRRLTLKRKGLTYTERLNDAIRSGGTVKQINWEDPKKAKK